jgi:putative hemolysin
VTHDLPPAAQPFSLPNPIRQRLLARAAAPALRAVEHVLGLARLNRLYDTWRADGRADPRRFPDRALEIIGAAYDIDPADLARIPPAGPAVVVANHPHGALDGLVLASLLTRRRRDVRLMGNYLLARIPELRPLCIFVDPFGDRRAAGRNASGMREAWHWVTGGGMLVVFPAGEVSHARSLSGIVADPAWSRAVVRLAERTLAPVLPVYIGGTNSRLFQAAGLLHPRLRTLLLARELLAQAGRTVQVRVGDPIPWSRLGRLRSPESRTLYLRVRTYGLVPAAAPRGGRGFRRARGLLPVSAAVPPAQVAADVAALPPERVLLRSGDLSVVCAGAHELPHVLPEIGRLRELAFRAEGEGTGGARDLDGYDETYRHLFVWNEARREIAGAYRLGPTDALGAGHRPHRLYTRSLFRFGRPLLARLGPALELGRSFVRAEYQRDFGTLMLLWKGIGRFVASAPRYRMLFGPVSVSPRYRAVSHELLVTVLSGRRYRSPLSPLVSSKRPIALSIATDRPGPPADVSLTADDLDRMLTDIEGDGHGLPVLLRQYLRLDAKFLAFSIDPAFGRALDGLMVVDLVDVERSLLQRYMGREGAAGFLAHHRAALAAPAGTQPAVASA